ncbi:hypothetical protein ABMA27_013003 [Loxostege sticticalis]|uniref:Shugoshin C-terminal domain-containing protein n=1 Tax=Loxostege sticticalis TaxID=481309 RepID=A0ABR3IDP3_LOXSC
MSTPEDEIKDLREKNNELVQKVQYWKMTAAQRENEKLELMKEINELRLKLSRIRSGGAAQARKLDAALQTASEEALSHLVQASGAVARTIELAKTYMRDRQELDEASPRWSNISGTPNNERVHRVPPMMIGGQSIQPVVSLSRTILNTSNPRTGSRSPNQSINRSVTERAVPMHMLQDVYIPLTRIDAALHDQPGNNMDSDTEQNNIEDSTEDLGLEDSHERSLDESQNITEEDFEESRRLDAVTEDVEPEDEIETPPRSRIENPLEGPSWLLDLPNNSKYRLRSTLEPDSTTELEETEPAEQAQANDDAEKENTALSVAAACEFSPTVRRRKRTASPPDLTPPRFEPRPHPARRLSTSGRILKVLVAKMRLDDGGDGDASPPKRTMKDSPVSKRDSPTRRSRESRDSPTRKSRDSPGRKSRDVSPGRKGESPSRVKKPVWFDAPSPNGSTDARVIVSEVIPAPHTCSGGGDAARSTSAMSRDSDTRSNMSCDSRDSDSAERDEGRTRRPRKAVTYKEKPLNRKMRR